MTLVQKLLLAGIPTVAAGSAGVGIILINKSKSKENETLEGKTPNKEQQGPQDTNVKQQPPVVSGIKVGDDAAKTTEPVDLIRQAGLNCGDASKEIDCSIGSTGLNVDRDGKKENLFPSGTDNGNIKFRLSDDSTYKDKFRFTITGKPITLQSKTDSTQTITLEKYENYGLEKVGEKVYLTRKLTSEQGKIKSLGLPSNITLPADTSSSPSKCNSKTCEITKEQIGSVNFDGKKAGGATSIDKVNLNIYKVNDTNTFGGGYKFSFQPYQELTLPGGSKIAKDVWWDFKLKDPNADDLVLEKVWKDEKELLKKVGLTCNGNSTCTINDGSLKIKVGNGSIDNGKKKSDSTGTLYLEKNRSGHYEGLRFSVWGGGITIVSSSSPETTLKMEETEIYHITKEDNPTSSYYLARKHDIKEMIPYLLGLDHKNCTMPDAGKTKECTVQSADLGKIKFHVGGNAQTITGNSSNLTITVASGQDSTYLLGYKFSIKTVSGTINVGSISLSNTSATDFKIKKDVSAKKLYLEKA